MWGVHDEGGALARDRQGRWAVGGGRWTGRYRGVGRCRFLGGAVGLPETGGAGPVLSGELTATGTGVVAS